MDIHNIAELPGSDEGNLTGFDNLERLARQYVLEEAPEHRHLYDLTVAQVTPGLVVRIPEWHREVLHRSFAVLVNYDVRHHTYTTRALVKDFHPGHDVGHKVIVRRGDVSLVETTSVVGDHTTIGRVVPRADPH